MSAFILRQSTFMSGGLLDVFESDNHGWSSVKEFVKDMHGRVSVDYKLPNGGIYVRVLGGETFVQVAESIAHPLTLEKKL